MSVDADQRLTSAPLLDSLDQIAGRLRLKQTVNVLHADGIATRFFDLLSYVHEHRDGVHRTGPIADCALCMLAGLLHGINARLQVSNVIQCVEDAEDIDTIQRGLLDKPADDRVIKILVADQVLSAQQHMQSGFGEQPAVSPQPLPRVFIEKAYAGMECHPAPTLQRPIARIVQVFTHRHDVFDGHAGFQKTLLRFSQQQLGDFHGACDGTLLYNDFVSSISAAVFRRPMARPKVSIYEIPTANEIGSKKLLTSNRSQCL